MRIYKALGKDLADFGRAFVRDIRGFAKHWEKIYKTLAENS